MLLSLRYIRSQLIWVCVCAVHARYFFVTWWLLVSVRFKFAFYNINWWMLQSGHKLYVVVATYENNIIRILCKCHNSFNVHQHNVQQFSSHGCCTHAWRFHRNTPTLLCTQHINKKPIKGRESAGESIHMKEIVCAARKKHRIIWEVNKKMIYCAVYSIKFFGWVDWENCIEKNFKILNKDRVNENIRVGRHYPTRNN